MGRANRALAGRVDAIAGGFLPEGGSGAHTAKTIVTGNPVRPAVLEAARKLYRPSGRGDPFRLLVFGGSQGAAFFSEALPPAIADLPEAWRRRLSITQQARAEDLDAVRAAYEKIGVQADVSPFFSDMSQRMADAHLVISRSGASTVSEISVIGRPSLLVPYPYALDHDQAANAAALAQAGGAEVHVQSTLTKTHLTQLLASAMDEAARLTAMAHAARSVGKPEATRLLADLTEAIASGKSVAEFREGVRS
jgi:UDP-N-acetylglucosamine--N-acetylmuramyl-(pentapeptide) pyrophosphoryl-undecaprenol N-acetylglucosamine transferase